jgi:tRNA pseudouridine38/39 synthase
MNHLSSPPGNLTAESCASDLPNYETWTREELIARLKELTGPSIPQTCITTSAPTSSPGPPTRPTTPKSEPQPDKPKRATKAQKKSKSKREFNFSAYPTRKIALKFSYAGAGYGGLAWQPSEGPLPTVEGVLFAALTKARLVDPDAGLEGCGWERCGRTDRGVSAAGQVVSLYVRSSNRPSSSSVKTSDVPEEEGACDASGSASGGLEALDAVASAKGGHGALRYLHTLNGILPPSIRVYAWAPVGPAFSARFSCRARHYKYFFSGRNLDVDAMRAGAARLVGEHDFRNLCKLDPARQLTSFRRRILRADVSPLSHDANGMHVFDLVGTAFLYNQVRHIMAVLLLIGARFESASVVSALLNADPSAPCVHPEDEEPPPLVTCKPEYQMADALPLVLWDCVYEEQDVGWRTDDAGSEGGSVGLHTQLTGLAERAQVEATLAEQNLAAASQFHAAAPVARGVGPWEVPLGGGRVRREGRYVGLLLRKRLSSVEDANGRYRGRRGHGGPSR